MHKRQKPPIVDYYRTQEHLIGCEDTYRNYRDGILVHIQKL